MFVVSWVLIDSLPIVLRGAFSRSSTCLVVPTSLHTIVGTTVWTVVLLYQNRSCIRQLTNEGHISLVVRVCAFGAYVFLGLWYVSSPANLDARADEWTLVCFCGVVYVRDGTTGGQPERDLDRGLDECECMFMARVALVCDASRGLDLGRGSREDLAIMGFFRKKCLRPKGTGGRLNAWTLGLVVEASLLSVLVDVVCWVFGIWWMVGCTFGVRGEISPSGAV